MKRILYASVEVAPFAKVGGLADVAGSLPMALSKLGNDVKIVMPAYGMATAGRTPKITRIPVTINSERTEFVSVWEVELNGVPVWMLDGENLFQRVERSEDLYAFGRDDYLLFSAAVMAVCERLDWIPDIAHANDWHTGFLSVFIREKGGERWQNTACTFTIHNLKYQGVFGKDTLEAAGLSDSLFTSERLENWGSVNFIKSACAYSDAVNTVSPTYAEEICDPEYGVGQWGLMRDLRERGKLCGILNGIDLDFFNPETDKFIAKHFNTADLSGKKACKSALQEELGLPVDDVPLFGIVSRLSDQKGFDLIIRQAYAMLNLPAQLVVLGTGDPWAAAELRKIEQDWPHNLKFVERYDAPLAQRIYAGSDFFLMPSAFEPCGLGQMIACRYGTIPIVRKTGGLADTIFEGENGFVFEEYSARELLKTCVRAVNNKDDALVVRTMNTDFSWTRRALEYEQMYAFAQKRAACCESPS